MAHDVSYERMRLLLRVCIVLLEEDQQTNKYNLATPRALPADLQSISLQLHHAVDPQMTITRSMYTYNILSIYK